MNSHLRAAVIGGGVTGCSILYHLTRAGWADIALFERSELTAGATWHSSGHIAHYTQSPQLTQLSSDTRAQLKRIELEAEQPLGLMETGSLRLATSTAAYQNFAAFSETAAGIGCGARMVSRAEAAAMWPLADLTGVEGALLVAHDCRLNAADFTQAMAKAARAQGAAVHRETEVTTLTAAPGGGWVLHTNQGAWTAEHVITASGIFARRSLPALGITLPVAVVSHQYLVTDAVPQIAARRAQNAPALPILRHPDIGLNIREEGDGYCISLYEQNAQTVFPDGPPGGFGMELFAEDFDSIEAGFEEAMRCVPSMGEAGIRSTVHGPMPWSPDFAPMVGPAPGARNLWVAEALSYGVSWSGGVAERLARWITTGDPGDDMSRLDPRRFGRYATSDWADAQALAAYKGVYGTGEGAYAPAQTPVHDLLAAAGATFEEHYGTAVAKRFPASSDAASSVALHVPPAPDLLHLSGPDAERFLKRQLSTPLKRLTDQYKSSWLLSDAGTVLAEVTVRQAPDGPGFELGIAAACPEAAIERLKSCASAYADLILQPSACKFHTLILMGSAAYFEPAGITLPAHPGTVAEDPAGGRVVSMPPLGDYARWALIIPEDRFRSRLEALLGAVPEIRLLGTEDYADMQIVSGEPVCGREIRTDMTQDGRQVRSDQQDDPMQLAQIQVDVTDTILPPINTCLLGPQGDFLGHLVSVARDTRGLSGFAMLRQSALETKADLTLKVGGTAQPVSAQKARYAPAPAGDTFG